MSFVIKTFEPKYQSGLIEMIQRIQVEEFQLPIQEEQKQEFQSISNSFQKNNGNYWVALFNEKVVGSIAVMDIGHKALELRDVFLDKTYRGEKQGFSKKITRYGFKMG